MISKLRSKRAIAALSLAPSIGVAATVLAIMSVSRSTASPHTPFALPERLPDVAQDQVSSASVAKSGDVLVELSNFLSDETETVVGLTVRAPKSFGNASLPVEPPTLTDQDGNVLIALRGTASQLDRTQVTWVFPPIEDKPGALRVALGTMWFADSAALDVEARGGPAAIIKAVDGNWNVGIEFRGGRLPVSSRRAVSTSAQLGQGRVVVDQVVVAPTGVIVSGHLTGFTFDEIPEFRLTPWIATTAGRVDYVSLRGGFGVNRELFEVRFPPIAEPGELMMGVGISLRDQPLNDTAAVSVASKLPIGATAMLLLGELHAP